MECFRPLQITCAKKLQPAYCARTAGNEKTRGVLLLNILRRIVPDTLYELHFQYTERKKSILINIVM